MLIPRQPSNFFDFDGTMLDNLWRWQIQVTTGGFELITNVQDKLAKLIKGTLYRLQFLLRQNAR